MNRIDDWYMRVYFPSSARVELGAGYETWILDPQRYEGHQELKARAATLGRRWTKRDLAYELVDNLLADVLAAAGGVEQSILALRSAVAEAQAWSDESVFQPTPGVPHGISHPSVVRAWYEFANVLSWARVVEERLDRRPFSKKAKSGDSALPNQGLINAVKPVRLKKRLDKLVSDLRSGPLTETRLLANFTLHSALVRNPNSGARLNTDGTVIMPIPDKSTGPIAHPKLLTWNDKRDAIVFSEELWESVETFMDGLVEAFEKATPKRLRK